MLPEEPLSPFPQFSSSRAVLPLQHERKTGGGAEQVEGDRLLVRASLDRDGRVGRSGVVRVLGRLGEAGRAVVRPVGGLRVRLRVGLGLGLVVVRHGALVVARLLGLALAVLADDLLAAVLAVALLELALVVAVAGPLLLALVAVALGEDTLAIVADDLALALLAVALAEVALLAVADDELVGVVLLLAGLGAAVVVLTDDAVMLALVAVLLGGAPVAVADDLLVLVLLLLLLLLLRAVLLSVGHDLGPLLADGAVVDIGRAGGDGANVSAGDGLGDGVGLLRGGGIRVGAGSQGQGAGPDGKEKTRQMHGWFFGLSRRNDYGKNSNEWQVLRILKRATGGWAGYLVAEEGREALVKETRQHL